MLCSRVQNLLSAYCDYELTGEEMLSIREHLGQCPDCAREHASLRQVKQLLRSLPEVEADRPFVPEVLDKEPRIRWAPPLWFREWADGVRISMLRCRESACHLAAGAALGLSVLAATALQSPPPLDASRALVPQNIASEPSPSASSVFTEATLPEPLHSQLQPVGMTSEPLVPVGARPDALRPTASKYDWSTLGLFVARTQPRGR